jgi:hypothetical protein
VNVGFLFLTLSESITCCLSKFPGTTPPTFVELPNLLITTGGFAAVPLGTSDEDWYRAEREIAHEWELCALLRFDR